MVCSYVGVEGKPLPVKDNSYDLVTVCGSMGQNMMPCSGVCVCVCVSMSVCIYERGIGIERIGEREKDRKSVCVIDRWR